MGAVEILLLFGFVFAGTLVLPIFISYMIQDVIDLIRWLRRNH